MHLFLIPTPTPYFVLFYKIKQLFWACRATLRFFKCLHFKWKGLFIFNLNMDIAVPLDNLQSHFRPRFDDSLITKSLVLIKVNARVLLDSVRKATWWYGSRTCRTNLAKCTYYLSAFTSRVDNATGWGTPGSTILCHPLEAFIQCFFNRCTWRISVRRKSP